MICPKCKRKLSEAQMGDAKRCPYCEGNLAGDGCGKASSSSRLVCTLLPKEKALWLWIPLAYAVLFVCGCLSFPEFIRAVPGDDFLEYAFFWGIAVALGTAALYLWKLVSLCTTALRKSARCEYSDSDLMFFWGHSIPRKTGYYLLKAKLLGIVEITDVVVSDAVLVEKHVRISDKIHPDDMEAFCEKDAYLHKIVNYIRDQESKGETVTVADIINSVVCDPKMNSEGGWYVWDFLGALNSWKNCFLAVGLAVMYSLPFLKLLMGLVNGKAVGFLLVMMVLLYPAFAYILHMLMGKLLSYESDSRCVVPLRSILSRGFGRSEELMAQAQDPEVSVSQEEAAHMLRSYVFCNVPEWIKPGSDYGVKNSILFAVSVAEAREAALRAARERAERASSSGSIRVSSGGSGGSGGGGGGGRGCGGCGD